MTDVIKSTALTLACERIAGRQLRVDCAEGSARLNLYVSSHNGAWQDMFQLHADSTVQLAMFAFTGRTMSCSVLNYQLGLRVSRLCQSLRVISDFAGTAGSYSREDKRQLLNFVLGASLDVEPEKILARCRDYALLAGEQAQKAEEESGPAIPTAIVKDGRFVDQAERAVVIPPQQCEALLAWLPEGARVSQLQGRLLIDLPTADDGTILLQRLNDLQKILSPSVRVTANGVRMQGTPPRPAALHTGYDSPDQPLTRQAFAVARELNNWLAGLPMYGAAHPQAAVTATQHQLSVTIDEFDVGWHSEADGEDELSFDNLRADVIAHVSWMSKTFSDELAD